MRREHVLDRQFEHRLQPFEDLLGRHARSALAPETAQSVGNSRPLPRSMSESPVTSARRLSIQSMRSFGSIPGNASTPTASRSPAENTCPPTGLGSPSSGGGT